MRLLVLAIAGIAFYWKTYLLEARGDPFTRGPFITRLTTDSAPLWWRVRTTPVELRAVGADGSRASAGDGRFSGLTPGTRYAWTAAVGGVVRASGCSTPPPSAATRRSAST